MPNPARRATICAALFAGSLAAAVAPQWTRVTTPNFELYTTAGEKAGRDAAVHFEQVRAFFAQASPVKPPGDFPLRIIAFATPDQYRSYTPNPRASAFFAAGPGRDYIVMRDASPENYSIAVHEYVHFVIRHSGLRVPLWLSEGWADVYASMRRVRDGMAVGDLVPVRMRALDSAKGAWFDYPTLTTVRPNSPVYNEGDRTGLFYAQSWALAHMLFLSPEYRDNFRKFLMGMHNGELASDAAQTAFGKSGQEVFADARSYFDRKKLVGTVFQTNLGKAESEPVVAAIEDFDSRLILSDLQVATGRADLARLEYERLEKLKPERKDLQQSMGYLFWSIRDNNKAKDHLAKAFAMGVTDPQLCYTLALLQMATGEALPQITATLERAVAGAPAFTDALLQLGIVRALDREFEGAKQALLAVPAITADKAPAVYFTLANAYLQTGDIETARTHLATARKYAKKPEEKEIVENLLVLLEARAKSTFAPRPGEKLVRTEGMAVAVECGNDVQKLQFRNFEGSLITVDLPATAAVEIIHQGTGQLQLQCGPVTPFRAVIEYGLASAVRQGSVGVLRSLQF